MRARTSCVLATLLLVAGCGSPPDQRTYPLQGQVVSVDAGRKQATVKHDEIVGLMPAMTMPYTLQNDQSLQEVKPGDLINATLVIVSNDAYLTDVRKVGEAPLEKPPAEAPAPASSGFELLTPGEPVPATSFVDQDGKKQTLESFRGSTVLLTFMYTACPLPTFCPLMDRHFATLQTALKADKALDHVHLVSVSFDPTTDTPAVLKKHARTLGADPSRWTFLTGDRDDVDRFAMRFGVSISRALNDARDITHNLRTAIVDPDGRLSKVYIGNEWTPDQLLADVKATAARPKQ